MSQDIEAQLREQRRKVDVEHYDLTVREIVRMVQEKELHRAPEYQRKFRWGQSQESRLVESLILGLPVPPIYVATNEDSTWELVDGLQRVSTLVHFFTDNVDELSEVGKEKPLRLIDLDKLSLLNGMRFDDLPPAMQLMFSRCKLRVTSLSDKSDIDVRFDMFERLNGGGINLTPQEVRSCVFRGRFSSFLKEMAANEEFTKLLKLRKGNLHDGTKEEIVLKFLAYLNFRDHYRDKVRPFLNTYMNRASGGDFDYSTHSELFNRVVNHLFSLTQGPLLRASSKGVTPQNQLEALMVAAAEIIRAGEEFGQPADGWVDDKKLASYSSGGTNSKSSLNGRIQRAKELLRA